MFKVVSLSLLSKGVRAHRSKSVCPEDDYFPEPVKLNLVLIPLVTFSPLPINSHTLDEAIALLQPVTSSLRTQSYNGIEVLRSFIEYVLAFRRDHPDASIRSCFDTWDPGPVDVRRNGYCLHFNDRLIAQARTLGLEGVQLPQARVYGDVVGHFSHVLASFHCKDGILLVEVLKEKSFSYLPFDVSSHSFFNGFLTLDWTPEFNAIDVKLGAGKQGKHRRVFLAPGKTILDTVAKTLLVGEGEYYDHCYRLSNPENTAGIDFSFKTNHLTFECGVGADKRSDQVSLDAPMEDLEPVFSMLNTHRFFENFDISPDILKADLRFVFEHSAVIKELMAHFPTVRYLGPQGKPSHESPRSKECGDSPKNTSRLQESKWFLPKRVRQRIDGFIAPDTVSKPLGAAAHCSSSASRVDFSEDDFFGNMFLGGPE